MEKKAPTAQLCLPRDALVDSKTNEQPGVKQKHHSQMENILNHEPPRQLKGKVTYVHAMTRAEKLKFLNSPARELPGGLVQLDGSVEKGAIKENVPKRINGKSFQVSDSKHMEQILNWD